MPVAWVHSLDSMLTSSCHPQIHCQRLFPGGWGPGKGGLYTWPYTTTSRIIIIPALRLVLAVQLWLWLWRAKSLWRVVLTFHTSWRNLDQVVWTKPEIQTEWQQILQPTSRAGSQALYSVVVGDNCSLKFRGSELAWEIYVLSSRGSSRIFKGLHQMPWISRLFEDENSNFSRPAVLVAACHVIWLFWTSPLKISQAIKTLMALFLRFMC